MSLVAAAERTTLGDVAVLGLAAGCLFLLFAAMQFICERLDEREWRRIDQAHLRVRPFDQELGVARRVASRPGPAGPGLASPGEATRGFPTALETAATSPHPA